MNVDANENENEKKKNVRATPGLVGTKLLLLLLLFCSRHLDVLINRDIPGLKVSNLKNAHETTDDTARRHATFTRSLQDASCE